MPTPLGWSRRTKSVVSAVVAALIALGAWYAQQGGGSGDEPTSQRPPAAGETDPDSGLPYVEEADLPEEAVETLRLIDAGGPFPHDEDGSTFENREGILPDREDGYYQEYTVETPGSDDRGARRIVAGDGGELYWTEDHYASFARIRR